VDVVGEAGDKYRAELKDLYRRGFDEKNARLWFALLHKVVQDRAAKKLLKDEPPGRAT